MFSKKLLGTLVLIAAAVVVPGSAAAEVVGPIDIPAEFVSLRSSGAPTFPEHPVQYRGRVRVGAMVGRGIGDAALPDRVCDR